MKRYNHRTANKPYSEKTRAEKIAEHKDAITRLSHPHNLNFATGQATLICQDAIRRHREALCKLETEK